jgi:16S rRNA (guanine(966)-N(2))-methyltransferase RsmD
LRIIAGQFKGRALKTPTWEGLRPTSDKLRETLFNVLAPKIDGARVLDAFAGTGAIGIEALSRGASHVVFVEHDRRAAALIQANLDRLAIAEGYTIVRDRLESVARHAGAERSFDVMILDPPYAFAGVERLIAQLAPALAPDGCLVLEHAARRPPESAAPLQLVRTIRSGDSALSLFAPHGSVNATPSDR